MRPATPILHAVYCLALIAVACSTLMPRRAHAETTASFRVRLSLGSPRLAVTATLPIAGAALRMATTRPAGIPELDSLGWAGLVRDLCVSDAAARAIPFARDGTRGWKLARPDSTTLHLEYEVDYAPLQRLDWPAPREAAYRDLENFVLVGRSLFVTTDETRACRVTFELPTGWHAATPWRPEGGGESYVAGTPSELTENLVVLSQAPRDLVIAKGLHLHVNALGHWAPFRTQIRRLLEPVVRHHVALMGSLGRRDYVLVFLPQLEEGAESYRSSFALCSDSLPNPRTSSTWGNLVAHEMFHMWNGWLLHGADYMRSQWFHEGFTEYAANTAIAGSGLVDAEWFRGKLAQHVQNSRRLTTTLEEIGGRKGPPLYSAGALVAFSWDVKIREVSEGRRDLGHFFRELMRLTDGGRREYAWADLRRALEASATYDWETFYQSHIRGNQRLTIEQSLAAVGQRMVEEPEGRIRIEADPGASAAARRRWAGLVRSR